MKINELGHQVLGFFPLIFLMKNTMDY